jgi:hypothetical protein
LILFCFVLFCFCIIALLLFFFRFSHTLSLLFLITVDHIISYNNSHKQEASKQQSIITPFQRAVRRPIYFCFNYYCLGPDNAEESHRSWLVLIIRVAFFI